MASQPARIAVSQYTINLNCDDHHQVTSLMQEQVFPDQVLGRKNWIQSHNVAPPVAHCFLQIAST
jgi:hypothetical protein